MPPAASRWDPPQNTWSNRAAGQRLARSNPFLAFLPNRTHPDQSRLPSTPIQSGLLRDKDEFSAVCALAPLAVLFFVRSLRPDACVVLPRGHLDSEEPPAAGHQHRQPDDRGHGKDAPCPVAGAAAGCFPRDLFANRTPLFRAPISLSSRAASTRWLSRLWFAATPARRSFMRKHVWPPCSNGVSLCPEAEPWTPRCTVTLRFVASATRGRFATIFRGGGSRSWAARFSATITATRSARPISSSGSPPPWGQTGSCAPRKTSSIWKA